MTHIAIARKSLAAIVAIMAGMMLFAPTPANAAAPFNDNFEDATFVSAEAPWGPAIDVKVTTDEATLQVGEPTPSCGSDKMGKTVWFWYPATQDGTVTVQADTIGTDYDTVVGVWRGDSLSTLTEVACNDDQAGRSTSVSVFEATKSTSYYIQVGGYDGQGGELSFNLGPPRFGSITGTVRSDAVGPLRRICVDAFLVGDNPGRSYTKTTASGQYALTGLLSGLYEISFYDCDGTFDHTAEWYDDKGSRAEADEVVVASPGTTEVIDTELSSISLSVSTNGSGVGSLISNPAGIDCGDDCTEVYEHGTLVTVTPAAGENSVFNGWSGCASVTGNDCKVTMDAAKTVTATFKLERRHLSVTRTGSGTGAVTGTGINCSANTNVCENDYEHGASVTLTATPDANSIVGEWAGCDIATDNRCTVTMAAAKNVIAKFDLPRKQLTVATTGSGSGTVTGNGISCGAASTDCSEDFDHGASVTLTANPSANSFFAGWTGCQSATGSQCSATMSAARSVTATFELDTTPLETTITASPPQRTLNPSASFSFTATKVGSTFDCSIDGATFSSCTSPKSYSSLAEGTHTFLVRATDAVGNVDGSPAERTWTVDLTPPETTLLTGPSGPTPASNVTFTFEANEQATFQCALDAGAFTTCTSPKSYLSLAEGSHTFRVRATDTVGHVDATPPQRTFTVDVKRPETTLTSGPSGTTSSPQATFTFETNEAATFACSLDGDTFSTCKSPQTYPGLDEGSHSFRVRATDDAGNVDQSPAERTWVIDFTRPETLITSGPTGIVSSKDAAFTFKATEASSTFYCSLDGGGFSDCMSPKAYTGLGDGLHTFRVRATDAAGNVDGSAAERSWTVDTVGPTLTVQRPTGGLYINDQAVGTGPTSVVIGFVTVQVRAADPESGVSDFRFEVDGTAVDPAQVTFQGGAYQFTYRPATPGQHTITSRATNGSGISTSLNIAVVGVPAG